MTFNSCSKVAGMKTIAIDWKVRGSGESSRTQESFKTFVMREKRKIGQQLEELLTWERCFLNGQSCALLHAKERKSVERKKSKTRRCNNTLKALEQASGNWKNTLRTVGVEKTACLSFPLDISKAI